MLIASADGDLQPRVSAKAVTPWKSTSTGSTCAPPLGPGQELNPLALRPSLLVFNKKKTARQAREAGLYPGVPSVVVKAPVQDNLPTLEVALGELLSKREACPSPERPGAHT